MINIFQLSQTFNVRKLTPDDVDQILNLSLGNEIFYQYHTPVATMDSILKDMEMLPPGKDLSDKFYIGIFKELQLIAVMDLISGYPDLETAYIGLFMMDIKFQGKGTGSQIIEECACGLKKMGYRKIRLAVDWDNPQSNSFWRKNHFIVTDEEKYISMERIL